MLTEAKHAWVCLCLYISCLFHLLMTRADEHVTTMNLLVIHY